MRVPVRGELLDWAVDRSRLEPGEVARRFPQFVAWKDGKVFPTLRQLETFARATRTPVGYFFLPEAPVDKIPIPDFRTVGSERISRPSPDLLETIYICQQRQDWYREFARSEGEPAFPYFGSATLRSDVVATAASIRRALGFDVQERARLGTWTEALRLFISQADELGILVMVSGVVGSNNNRGLDPDEFRGFALADPLSPLVFINGADSKAAQMFTLAHELAHIWIGQSALSDVGPVTAPTHAIEVWCNQVAAEMLVPLAELRTHAQREAVGLVAEVQRLARLFKVSTLVVLRRLSDAGLLSAEQLRKAYREEVDRLRSIPKGNGGNFYLTLAVRASKRFARALVLSTLEGQTLHRDAFRLLGFSKLSTFRELGHSLGVA